MKRLTSCKDKLMPIRTQQFLTTLLLLAMPLIACSIDNRNLTLQGLDGKQHVLKEYIGQGKWVVFNIWGPRCIPCIQEMPDLQRFHDAHKNTDAIVVGMALDFPGFGYANISEVRLFVAKHNIRFPILLGDKDSIQFPNNGRLSGTPTTILFSPKGEMIAVKVGRVTQAMIEKFIRSYPQ